MAAFDSAKQLVTMDGREFLYLLARRGFPEWYHHAYSMADQSAMEGLLGGLGSLMYLLRCLLSLPRRVSSQGEHICFLRGDVWLQLSCERLEITILFFFLGY